MNDDLNVENSKMIKNILTLRYDPSQETNFPKKTWKDFEEKPSSKETEFIEESIQNTFRNSIPTNEGHVSVALSGGIDSSLTLALLRKTLPDIEIDALSVVFEDSLDESKEAQKIAEKFEANHQIMTIGNYLEELPKAISIFKMPFWDIHWFYVVKKAKQLSNILLSGDGGDELFGGYTFRYKKFLSSVKPELNATERTKLYLNCHERDWVPDQAKLFGQKANFSWDEIYSMIDSYFKNNLDPINQVFLADFNGKLLYNWIPLNSSFHRYFDVKSVAPLLSNELVSFATHLSHDLKYDLDGDVGKILLRKVLGNYLPADLISSSKHGFSVNTLNLWKNHGYKLCKHYLSDARVVKDGWINEDWISIHIENVENLGVRYVNKFLGLLALEIWYRLFVTKEINADTKL